MTLLQFVKTSAVSLACVGMVLPMQPAFAKGPAPSGDSTAVGSRVAIQDVALDDGGTLRGTVLNPEGQPLAGMVVVVQSGDRRVRRVTTDDQGRFAAAPLQGGVYGLRAGSATRLCRVWVKGTAPPGAGAQALIVAGEGVQRGQRPLGDLFLSEPFLIAVIIAAAIAIPVVVHNARDRASGS